MARALVLSVVQGAGLTITYTATALGDMTGWGAHAQIRTVAGGELLVDLNEGSGISIHGPTSIVVLTLTGTQTSALPASGAVFDLFVNPPGDQPIYFGGGSISVIVPVTVKD